MIRAGSVTRSRCRTRESRPLRRTLTSLTLQVRCMASRQVGARVPLAFLLFLLACGGGSTGPTTGSLALAVSGLPSGVGADVSVSVAVTCRLYPPGPETVIAASVPEGRPATVTASEPLATRYATAALTGSPLPTTTACEGGDGT